jgi:oligopeptidase B
MAPHKALTDALFEEMKGRSRKTMRRSDQGWRLAILVGVQAGHAISRLVSQAASGGEGTLIYSENAEAEDKEYYRPRRVRGQPRRQVAGDAGR